MRRIPNNEKTPRLGDIFTVEMTALDILHIYRLSLKQEKGDQYPDSACGDRICQQLQSWFPWVQTWNDLNKDMTIRELRAVLKEKGVG